MASHREGDSDGDGDGGREWRRQLPTTWQPTFAPKPDVPGSLGDNKLRRHNNDHASIREIQLLPTYEEITSEHREYLPLLDPTQWHLRGAPGLIDRHFRMLREDSIGPLRDAIRAELYRLRGGIQTDKDAYDDEWHVYENIRLEDLRCVDRHRGLEFVVSFPQPEFIPETSESTQQRQHAWERSGRLSHSSLVCLTSASGLVLFGIVNSLEFKTDVNEQEVGPYSVKRYNLHSDPMKAYVRLNLASSGCEPAKDLANLFFDVHLGEISLVEFPGVLFPSFRFTLEGLQNMIATNDLPFANLLAPTISQPGKVNIPPPAYAQKPNFRYDLSCILSSDKKFSYCPNTMPYIANVLWKYTELDHAQLQAVIDALSRSLAMIQGPPGCGKSFTGVSIARVLLANKKQADLGPIICVCYTNHALDQFLEHLLDSGVEQLIRVGFRSKSERLKALNLKDLSRKINQTLHEKKQYRALVRELEKDSEHLHKATKQIKDVNDPECLKRFLERYYASHFAQLVREDENSHQRGSYRDHDVVGDWLDMNDFYPGEDRPDTSTDLALVETIQPVRNITVLKKPGANVWTMTQDERYSLYWSWMKSMKTTFQNELFSALGSYRQSKEKLDRIGDEQRLRCLKAADIVGVTNAGLARNLDLFRRVGAKVLLCEEAAEVQEGHFLTALLPSIEHAILIGDHLQLRTTCNNPKLEYHPSRARQYGMDISLFERLVQPPPELSGIPLPFSSLEIQRRMHPSISDLIRQTLYPKLKDGGDVANYPAIAGMRKRLFWLNHSRGETAHDANDKVPLSRSNDFEVRFTSALMFYLLSQGFYESEEIVVLTPYLGQLYKIRDSLRRLVQPVELEEQDVEALKAAGMGTENSIPYEHQQPMAIKPLRRAVKVATVDNFQGEESKVVVVSLVRSNNTQECGFLASPNRINVLLSRAKHGMYLIGDSETYQHVPMWTQVLELLMKDGNFGGTLQLCCPEHSDSVREVSDPEDFRKYSFSCGCTLLRNNSGIFSQWMDDQQFEDVYMGEG